MNEIAAVSIEILTFTRDIIKNDSLDYFYRTVEKSALFYVPYRIRTGTCQQLSIRVKKFY